MATKLNSVLLIAFVLVAMATIGSCTLNTPIIQARFIGTGLTCSNPSPLLFSNQVLSGANVSVACNGALATTTTDASGSFSTTVTFPSQVTVFSVILNCRPIITVPANCTIVVAFQRVTTLQTPIVFFQFVDNTVTGGLGQFNAQLFFA